MSTRARFVTLGLALWAGLSVAAETPAFLEPPKYVGPPSPLQAVTNRELMPEVSAQEGLAALECAKKILTSVKKNRWRDKIDGES